MVDQLRVLSFENLELENKIKSDDSPLIREIKRRFDIVSSDFENLSFVDVGPFVLLGGNIVNYKKYFGKYHGTDPTNNSDWESKLKSLNDIYQTILELG